MKFRAESLYDKFKRALRTYGAQSNIIIYQMGKVGSTAIEQSVAGSIHFHTLYNNSPCYVVPKVKRPGILGGIIVRLKFLLHRLLLRRKNTIKIISLIRDPIDRNISMFFQDLPFWLTEHIVKRGLDTRGEGMEFLNEAYQETFDHKYYERWFDEEIKRFSGIDIFAEPFDTNQGWRIFNRGKYQLLLIRFESLDKVHDVISNFLGFDVGLSSVNAGENKWYGQLYRAFKLQRQEIEAWPCSINSRSGRVAQHFGYNQAERKA